MASDYGLNFGFRRSDETMAVREGRYKTPASGSQLLQGVAVEIDPANDGFLKQSAANPKPITGYAGLLVQEDAYIGSVYGPDPINHDSFDLGITKLNTLSTIWCGSGTKIWLRNTAAQSRADGRQIAAVTVVDLTGVAVGDDLGWDGSKFVKVDGTTITNAWMRVTSVSTDYCEAVLQF